RDLSTSCVPSSAAGTAPTRRRRNRENRKMTKFMISRRKFLTSATIAGSRLVLSGCDVFDMLGDRDNAVRNFIEGANNLTYKAQRLIVGRETLAREYPRSEIRQPQRPNGSTDPDDDT